MHKVFTTWHGDKKLISEDLIVPRSSSYGIILRERKILLITLKTSDKLWFPGGSVDEGETTEEALVREIKEETGIDVRIDKHLIDVENNFYYDPQDMAWRQHSHFYMCTAISPDTTEYTNPDSTDEADTPIWCNIDELRKDHMQDYGYEIIRLLL